MLWSDLLWLTWPDSTRDIKWDWPTQKPETFLDVQQFCFRPCSQTVTLLPMLQSPPSALKAILSFSLEQGRVRCVFVFPKTEVPLFATHRHCKGWPGDSRDGKSGRDDGLIRWSWLVGSCCYTYGICVPHFLKRLCVCTHKYHTTGYCSTDTVTFCCCLRRTVPNA